MAMTILTLMQAIAVGLELYGVLLMAKAFFDTAKMKDLPHVFTMPVILLSSIVKGDTSRKAAEIYDIAPKSEYAILSLQGLSYLVLGFLLQLIALILMLFFI